MIHQNKSGLYIFRILSIAIFLILPFIARGSFSKDLDNADLYLLGPKADITGKWKGTQQVKRSIPILILAGHADSQGIAGAGTAGAAVDVLGAKPMNDFMSDELYWNLRIRDAIVKYGRDKGLNINSYNPSERNIIDPNDPRTNWSVGAESIRKGFYVLEIHFDSYGKYGFGSGLIPSVSTKLNTIDESLAQNFGRYPMFFRGGLGAPRRGIRILEIGKLEGRLESSLRNLDSRQDTISLISNKVVDSILLGIENSEKAN